ncbi:MAG: hypothetical protein AVDCRST_MAG18-3618 [uncultured Thermomicrobiales bacterium]|uniref:Uncharacterized protein n=1 Tax=uncultured Thermomicrobiales bacterium TaxID=1645740 RepID=A0A6J4VW07_9BACT|nr:MAG: hypothetical protein AVDCRST_MAG18-3618 [uncultured Thermomicrobiales bacterium]
MRVSYHLRAKLRNGGEVGASTICDAQIVPVRAGIRLARRSPANREP